MKVATALVFKSSVDGQQGTYVSLVVYHGALISEMISFCMSYCTMTFVYV